MSLEFEWLIGISGAIIAIIGGVITRDRQRQVQFDKVNGEVHSRINKFRDEYVRRDDLEVLLKHIQDSIKDLRDEMRSERKEVNSRLDAIIGTLKRDD